LKVKEFITNFQGTLLGITQDYLLVRLQTMGRCQYEPRMHQTPTTVPADIGFVKSMGADQGHEGEFPTWRLCAAHNERRGL